MATATVTVELTAADVDELEECLGGSDNMRLQRDPRRTIFRVVAECRRKLALMTAVPAAVANGSAIGPVDFISVLPERYREAFVLADAPREWACWKDAVTSTFARHEGRHATAVAIDRLRADVCAVLLRHAERVGARFNKGFVAVVNQDGDVRVVVGRAQRAEFEQAEAGTPTSIRPSWPPAVP